MSEKSSPVKVSNDIANKLRRTIERHNNGLTLENLRLSERYLENELRVLVYFRQGDAPEFYASFQRDGRTHRSLKIENRFHRGTQGIVLCAKEFLLDFRSVAWQHALARVCRSNREKKVMLIPNVEFMNVPQKLAAPASVWLDGSERLNFIWPQSLFYSSRFGFVFLGSQKRFLEFTSIIASRKVQIPEQSSSSGEFESGEVDKVIHRASQIVHGIPKNKAHIRGNGQDVIQAINAVSSLRIVLMRDSVSVFLVNKTAPEALKITDVMFGPF